MSDIWTRKRKPPRRFQIGGGFITGALAGFLFCYVVAGGLTFHFLVTIGYPWQMALPRAVLWMWTARVGTDLLAEDIINGTVKIKPQVCPALTRHGAEMNLKWLIYATVLSAITVVIVVLILSLP